jgi:small subunit ribosomal protein S16
MALKLRLMRIGKLHRPHYRVCVFDARTARGGRYVEHIGSYDPFIADDVKKVKIDRERAEYWLGVGAQPTETVAAFLRDLEIRRPQGPAKPRKPRKKKEIPMTEGGKRKRPKKAVIDAARVKADKGRRRRARRTLLAKRREAAAAKTAKPA